MRKLIFVLSLFPIAVVSVASSIAVTGLLDPTNIKENLPTLAVLFGVFFGVLTGASFRLLRLRLAQSNGRILIIGPGDKVEGAPGPATEGTNDHTDDRPIG